MPTIRTRFLLRIPLLILLFVIATAVSWGQIDDNDSLLSDTTDIGIDTSAVTDPNGVDTLAMDDSSFIPISNNDLDLDLPAPTAFYSVRNGGFVGGMVEFSSIKPSDLDSRLSGDLVVFGGEGYFLLSGWMIGGIGASAVLYDLPSTYDEFSLGYGGPMFGYEQQFMKTLFSAQIRSMVGLGGIRMIRKRPDIVDPAGLEILERVREESFLAFRPEVSLGFQPLGFLEFRLSASYLAPIGGSHVSDLGSLNYGLHVLLGVTY